MRTVLTFSLAAFAFASGIANAQSSERACRDSYNMVAPFMAVLRVPAEAPQNISLEGGWCVAKDINATDVYNTPDVNFRRLAWQGQGEPSSNALPTRFGLQARIEPGSASNRSNLPGRAAASRNGVNLHATLKSDADAGTIEVSQFKFDFPGDNSLDLSFRLHGVDLSSASALQISALNTKVELVRLELQSDGRLRNYFEQTIAEIDEIKPSNRAKVSQLISAFPDTFMSNQSQSAASRLLADLPDVRGDAMLELSSDAGFSPARFFVSKTSNPGDHTLEQALDGLTFKVEYRR